MSASSLWEVIARRYARGSQLSCHAAGHLESFWAGHARRVTVRAAISESALAYFVTLVPMSVKLTSRMIDWRLPTNSFYHQPLLNERHRLTFSLILTV